MIWFREWAGDHKWTVNWSITCIVAAIVAAIAQGLP